MFNLLVVSSISRCVRMGSMDILFWVYGILDQESDGLSIALHEV